MKKWIMMALTALMLTGCAAAPTFETLGNISHSNPSAPVQRQVLLELPDDAAEPVMADDSDTMYICDNYTIVLQTMEAGDLTATVRSLCGFTPDQLTVLESRCADHDRMDWVWTAAGEGGDVVCRAAVLDDGDFHYTLCVMADADEAGELTQTWNALFRSFCLEV